MRLTQIVNNLASNACKFTLSGGEIRIVTRLVYPAKLGRGQAPGRCMEEVAKEASEEIKEIEAVGSNEGEKAGEENASGRVPDEESQRQREGAAEDVKKRDFAFTRAWHRILKKPRANTDISTQPSYLSPSSEKSPCGDNIQTDSTDGVLPSVPLSTAHLSRHNSVEGMHELEKIVVRIEVHDTGFGIHARDLIDKKLFSPYVQTEVSNFVSLAHLLSIKLTISSRSESLREGKELGWASHLFDGS